MNFNVFDFRECDHLARIVCNENICFIHQNENSHSTNARTKLRYSARPCQCFASVTSEKCEN